MALATPGLSVAIGVIAALRIAAAQEPSVEDVLKRVGAYVAEFQKQLSGIVAEEIYDQNIRNASPGATDSRTRRRLKSDLLLVRPVGADRYVEFRDVFEVDGHAVRDREERLSRLFLNPPAGALSQLKQVMSESARYNIGNIFRTMNTPVLALGFLAADFQQRFVFKRGRDSTSAVWVLEFDERVRPTLIQTPRGIDMPSQGRFWLDPMTGAVSKTELIVEDADVRATVTVTYQTQPQIEFLVPGEMREAYVARRDRVEGRATYGRFRKFQVQVDEAIRPVKK